MTAGNLKPAQSSTVLAVLISGLGFLSATALFGGAMLLADPSGANLEIPNAYLRDSPFDDYRVPGAILFGVLGIGPLLAVYGIWRRPQWRWANALNPSKKMHWAWSASVTVGAALIVWIAIQVAVIGYASLLQPLYGILGLLILILSLHRSTRRALAERGEDESPERK